MSYLKKFTDVLGGIVAFIAAVFLVGKYMAFNPDDIEELLEESSKLKLFLSAEHGNDYRGYVLLIAFIVLSIAAGRLFKKLPVLSFCFCALPLLQVMNMIYTEQIYEYEGLFVILCALHFIGGIYELIYFDRADGKKRTFIAASLFGVLSSAACFAALKVNSFSKVFFERFLDSDLSEEEMAFEKKLQLIGIETLREPPVEEEKIITFVMIFVALSVVVALILRGVYFVDVILAAVPFVYVIYSWFGNKLIGAPMLVVVPVCMYFFIRVALFITGVGISESPKEAVNKGQ